MPEASQHVAAIDCGTNSIRLLIAKKQGDTLHEHERIMKTVRLGQGVDKTGEFSLEALERVFEACKEYSILIKKYDISPNKIRFVATSATRDATNKQVFLNGVYEILGVTPEVISGNEEASLSFAGAIKSLSIPTKTDEEDATNILLIDLGGGSTEFVLGTYESTHVNINLSISMDMGCVRMTERYLHSDPPTNKEIDTATKAIKEQIKEAQKHVPFKKADYAVGVAGTITTVTAAALDISTYDRDIIDGTNLSLDEIEKTTQKLIDASKKERSELGFMHPGRIDVIGAGALIYQNIAQALYHDSPISSITTSEHDILDGIAHSIAD